MADYSRFINPAPGDITEDDSQGLYLLTSLAYIGAGFFGVQALDLLTHEQKSWTRTEIGPGGMKVLRAAEPSESIEQIAEQIDDIIASAAKKAKLTRQEFSNFLKSADGKVIRDFLLISHDLTGMTPAMTEIAAALVKTTSTTFTAEEIFRVFDPLLPENVNRDFLEIFSQDLEGAIESASKNKKTGETLSWIGTNSGRSNPFNLTELLTQSSASGEQKFQHIAIRMARRAANMDKSPVNLNRDMAGNSYEVLRRLASGDIDPYTQKFLLGNSDLMTPMQRMTALIQKTLSGGELKGSPNPVLQYLLKGKSNLLLQAGRGRFTDLPDTGFIAELLNDDSLQKLGASLLELDEKARTTQKFPKGLRYTSSRASMKFGLAKNPIGELRMSSSTLAKDLLDNPSLNVAMSKQTLASNYFLNRSINGQTLLTPKEALDFVDKTFDTQGLDQVTFKGQEFLDVLKDLEKSGEARIDQLVESHESLLRRLGPREMAKLPILQRSLGTHQLTSGVALFNAVEPNNPSYIYQLSPAAKEVSSRMKKNLHELSVQEREKVQAAASTLFDKESLELLGQKKRGAWQARFLDNLKQTKIDKHLEEYVVDIGMAIDSTAQEAPEVFAPYMGATPEASFVPSLVQNEALIENVTRGSAEAFAEGFENSTVGLAFFKRTTNEIRAVMVENPYTDLDTQLSRIKEAMNYIDSGSGDKVVYLDMERVVKTGQLKDTSVIGFKSGTLLNEALDSDTYTLSGQTLDYSRLPTKMRKKILAGLSLPDEEALSFAPKSGAGRVQKVLRLLDTLDKAAIVITHSGADYKFLKIEIEDLLKRGLIDENQARELTERVISIQKNQALGSETIAGFAGMSKGSLKQSQLSANFLLHGETHLSLGDNLDNIKLNTIAFNKLRPDLSTVEVRSSGFDTQVLLPTSRITNDTGIPGGVGTSTPIEILGMRPVHDGIGENVFEVTYKDPKTGQILREVDEGWRLMSKLNRADLQRVGHSLSQVSLDMAAASVEDMANRFLRDFNPTTRSMAVGYLEYGNLGVLGSKRAQSFRTFYIAQQLKEKVLPGLDYSKNIGDQIKARLISPDRMVGDLGMHVNLVDAEIANTFENVIDELRAMALSPGHSAHRTKAYEILGDTAHLLGRTVLNGSSEDTFDHLMLLTMGRHSAEKDLLVASTPTITYTKDQVILAGKAVSSTKKLRSTAILTGRTVGSGYEVNQFFNELAFYAAAGTQEGATDLQKGMLQEFSEVSKASGSDLDVKVAFQQLAETLADSKELDPRNFFETTSSFRGYAIGNEALAHETIRGKAQGLIDNYMTHGDIAGYFTSNIRQKHPDPTQRAAELDQLADKIESRIKETQSNYRNPNFSPSYGISDQISDDIQLEVSEFLAPRHEGELINTDRLQMFHQTYERSRMLEGLQDLDTIKMDAARLTYLMDNDPEFGLEVPNIVSKGLEEEKELHEISASLRAYMNDRAKKLKIDKIDFTQTQIDTVPTRTTETIHEAVNAATPTQTTSVSEAVENLATATKSMAVAEVPFSPLGLVGGGLLLMGLSGPNIRKADVDGQDQLNPIGVNKNAGFIQDSKVTGVFDPGQMAITLDIATSSKSLKDASSRMESLFNRYQGIFTPTSATHVDQPTTEPPSYYSVRNQMRLMEY